MSINLLNPTVTDLVHSPMIDITVPGVPVQIQIRQDGTVLWINVGPVCKLRICGIDPNGGIVIDDERTD